MIFRAFDKLTSSFPAVFWSQLSPEDAAKRLAHESERGASSERPVSGQVTGNYVVLWRHRPFMSNPFAPIFAGSFRETVHGTQLVGEFRRRKIMLLIFGVSYVLLLPGIPFSFVAIPLMAIWLGVSVVAGVLAGAVFAFMLLGVLFAEAALIRLGMYAAKPDRDLIAEHIDGILGRGVAR
jgi:hypothetical protein